MYDYEIVSPSCIKLRSPMHFDPVQVFTCGQCFRWYMCEDGSFTGVAFGKVLNVLKQDSDIYLKNCTKEDFLTVWKDYFDLDRDYGKITNALSHDKTLKTAASYGSGIRILRQDFFEALISFIISANNNIPRIQGIIGRLCRIYGKSVSYNGETFYSFPSPDSLKGVTEEALAPLRSGYRAKYIVNAVKSFLNGEIDTEKIKHLSVSDARRELCKISGVGPKVADCILLFSFGRFDAFPTDVWVKRVMNELYGCEEKDAAKTGFHLFGESAGIAQQYLFYWRRAQ